MIILLGLYMECMTTKCNKVIYVIIKKRLSQILIYFMGNTWNVLEQSKSIVIKHYNNKRKYIN